MLFSPLRAVLSHLLLSHQTLTPHAPCYYASSCTCVALSLLCYLFFTFSPPTSCCFISPTPLPAPLLQPTKPHTHGPLYLIFIVFNFRIHHGSVNKKNGTHACLMKHTSSYTKWHRQQPCHHNFFLFFFTLADAAEQQQRMLFADAAQYRQTVSAKPIRPKCETY